MVCLNFYPFLVANRLKQEDLFWPLNALFSKVIIFRYLNDSLSIAAKASSSLFNEPSPISKTYLLQFISSKVLRTFTIATNLSYRVLFAFVIKASCKFQRWRSVNTFPSNTRKWKNKNWKQSLEDNLFIHCINQRL